jgi:hypothetical protein
VKRWAVLAAVILALGVWALSTPGLQSSSRSQTVSDAGDRLHSDDSSDEAGAKPQTVVQIVEFYAIPSTVAHGDSTHLCYGVMNARSVAIQPEVHRELPAHNHCVDVTPYRSTQYELTAVGADGKRVHKRFSVIVSAPVNQFLHLAHHPPVDVGTRSLVQSAVILR